MRHSMSKDTAFNGETTPRHTFLCSDSQCLPPGDPIILCAKHGSPITGKSFLTIWDTGRYRLYVAFSLGGFIYWGASPNKRGVTVRYAWVIIIPPRHSSDPLPFCTFYSIACYKHGKKGTLMHTVTPHEMSQTDLFNRLRQRFLIKRNTLTVACEAMTDSETKI